MNFSNYPPGVSDNTPDAPWNQVENEPENVDVCVSITMSKSTTISTTDYIKEVWDEYETGDEGERIHIGGTNYDFSESDLKSAYKNCELTIPSLLALLESYLLKDLEENKGNREKTDIINLQLESLRDWIVDELEVTQE